MPVPLERVHDSHHGVSNSSGGDGYSGLVLRDSRWRWADGDVYPNILGCPPRIAVLLFDQTGQRRFENAVGRYPVDRFVCGRDWNTFPQDLAHLLGFWEEDDRLDGNGATGRCYSSEVSGDSARSRRRSGELGLR